MINLAFAGCGFLGLYHTGVSTALRYHGNSFLSKVNRFSGSSSGALNAAVVVCDAPIELCLDMGLRIGNIIRKNIGLIPWQNLDQEIRQSVDEILPENAHIIATDKLFISISVLKGMKFNNTVVSNFETKDDLVQALARSCFIPLYSGWTIPRHEGVWYIDGAYTDNMPSFEGYENVNVSPVSGRGAHICPDDHDEGALEIVIRNTPIALTTKNISRLTRLLVPPPEDVLKNIYISGYRDGKRYLKKRGDFEVGPEPSIIKDFVS